MSISHSSEIPTLAGGMIDMEMITNPNISNTIHRRTKIICTIGPSCWDVENLEILIKTGMNVARLNFSHGDHEGHAAVLGRVRQAAINTNRNVGTFLFFLMTNVKAQRMTLEVSITHALPFFITTLVQLYCWIRKALKYVQDSSPMVLVK
jgi:Pyruvate kinase, barrel domain